MNEFNFSESDDAEKYFDSILETMKNIKIVSVFSACPDFDNYNKYRQYVEDTEIYILFENEQCLVIDYRFIDKLNANLRVLNETEKIWYENSLLKYFFNNSTDIYSMTSDNRKVKVRNQTISLEYDCLESICLEKVTKPYSKWIDNSHIEEIAPNATTFDKIIFKMTNGKSFSICPDCADTDGYTFVWSEYAQEIITNF